MKKVVFVLVCLVYNYIVIVRLGIILDNVEDVGEEGEKENSGC